MKIQNPIVKSGSNHSRDPWVVYHEGAYYHCFSRDCKVWVAKSDALENIGDGAAVAVFAPPEGTMYSQELWAPELHLLDGKWYVYVACDDGNNDNHRMYVLEGGTDPQGEYVFHGKITDSTDKWAIDGTVLEWAGVRYFVWSGWEGDINTAQNIYIARMDSPLTIDSERVCISRPELDWEKAGGDGVNLPFINEGPAALIHGERLHIIYSGGGSWCNDYCLSRLTLKNGGDPMNADDWEKCGEPVFRRNEAVKGPGHCSFTGIKGENGEWLDVVVYHAFDEDCTKGWGSCSARAQVFTWDGDTPVFGEPVALD